MTPRLLSRQEGVHNFTSGTLQNIAISSVDTSHTWVKISTRAAETDNISNVSYYVTADLTSSINLRLQRGGSTRDVTVEWVVLEFDSSVNVYRGSFTHGSTTINTSVTSVDLTKSVSEVTARFTNTMSTSLNIRDCVVRNRLTTSTELRTNLFTANSSCTCHWQVIEFTQNITVQQFEAANSTWPINITITSTVLAKSFLVFSWSANSSTTLCSEDILSCRLTAATTVRMEDFFAGAVSKFYNFYVLEYTGSDDFDVERGYTTMLGTTITPTIAKLKANSALFAGHEYNSLLEADVCSNNFRDHGATNKIDSDVQFTAQRFSGTNEGTLAWEVVEFASSMVPLHSLYKKEDRGVFRGEDRGVS